ncbi:MAG: hypothetical protein PHN98_06380 [Smithellaceae bacterium]|nr:hypothetical protein [Smithellaceae bacterium]
MFMSVGHVAVGAYARLRGFARSWRCPDRILVIESDDWGAIRTSTPEAYHYLVSLGYDMKRSRWSLDAMETDDDLTALFDVLSRFRDYRGCPAGMTANMVMANPDFAAIRDNGFQRYVYKPVWDNLAASPHRKGVTALWMDGMKNRLFRPQFHAREHIRWWEWMNALRNGSREAIDTFDLNMCGVPLAVSREQQSFFRPVFIDPPSNNNDDVDIARMISEGIEYFHKQFGFRSLSTVAPNVTWSDETERLWARHGIRYIQGGFLQHMVTDRSHRRIAHYLGERSEHGAIYLVRNCAFERSASEKGDAWQRCFSQINRAFYLKTPAIVCSHRVNFIGSIIESNRKRGLAQLEQLLSAVRVRWPDVNFLSSAELGYMIENNLSRVRDLEGRESEIFPAVGKADPLPAATVNGKNND